MKWHQIITKLLILTVSGFYINNAFGQDDKKASEGNLKNQVTEMRYTFFARSVIPMTGRLRQLTSEYTLSVSKDSIFCYLPYFGRAYTAPVNPSEGGINFTSASFTYKLKEEKKGGWTVTIKPKDVNDVQQLILNIFTNGNASLRVLSNNRQPISFIGSIPDSGL